jgi:hypothetical protein
MKKLTMISCLLALLALPATAAAHKGGGAGNGAKGCKAQSSKAGHGHGAGGCGKLKRRARLAAAQDCKAERSQDVLAFRTKYGDPADTTGDGQEAGAHAFRNCVKQNLKAAQTAITNATQDCRDERDADPGEFETKYATNENRRNAFGKCVSGHVRDELGSDNGDGADDGSDDNGADDNGDGSGDQQTEPANSGEAGTPTIV